MRKLFLPLLFLFGSGLGAYAQDPMIRTDLIPGSPTAGSIAKTGEVPFNLSTGLPSLSIPIFTVGGNELSLPISLNYSYDGLRPAQAAGWAGLGWNLDAGGVITRTIRDKVDGTMGTGNYNGSIVQTAINTYGSPGQNFLYNAPSTYDLQPDLYSFNFPGYSGKFIMHNGKAYIFPSQKLKITGGSSGFVIVTENGTKYVFDALETTNPKGDSGAPYNLPSSYTSALYLSKIENAAGTERILLDYAAEGKIANAGAYTQTYKKDINVMYDTTPNGPSRSFGTFVNPLRLSSITTEKYTVNFVAGSYRNDMNQSFGGAAYSLGGIEVYSKGTLVKNFKLNHSNTNYLMLNSVKECPTASTLTDTLTHRFEYESIDGHNRYEAFVDHYGFYTGRGNFPYIMIPTTLNAGGVDRTPALAGTIQGALKKVTYPSGGSSSFNYELNRGGSAGYEMDSHSVSAARTRPPGGSASVYAYALENIVITQGQYVTVTVIRIPYTEMGDGMTHNVEHDFEITNSSGVVHWGWVGQESENYGKTFTVYLEPGSYGFHIAADYRESYMNAYFSYNSLSNRIAPGAIAGGLRLNSMTTSSQAGMPLYRSYDYRDASGFSTGVPPLAIYDQKPWREVNVYSDRIEDKYYNLISSYISESYASGLPHFYSSVLEQQLSGTDTLFTRHDFRAFNGSFMGNGPSKITQYRKNSSGLLIPASEKIYDYAFVNDTVFNSMKSVQTMQVNLLGGFYGFPLYEFDAERSGDSQVWKYLRSTKDIVYEGTDSLVTVTRNSYDANRNLVYTTTTGSKGEVMVSKFKYPESYDGDFGFMTGIGMTSPVIEQQLWDKNGGDSVLVSGSLTEYSNASYKPVKQYTLTANGISALNGEGRTGTLYNNFMSDSRYQERANYSYDATGRLTSQQLVGGTPTSYKWGYAATLPYGHTSLGQMNHPVAEVKNALPAEFYHENFEEQGAATIGTANSGNRYYDGDFYLNWAVPNGRSYVATYFYRSSGKWHYKRQAYTGAVTLTEGDAIDDVSIYPADAQLGSYTYFEGIGNRSAIDAKGLKMDYEYDALNRLLNIRDQNGDIVKNYRYNQGTANQYYYNTTKSGNFSKNNCSAGLLGTNVLYTVPANTYGSATSQAAADAMATAAVASNGQSFANANGSCTTGVAISLYNDTAPLYAGGPPSASIYSLEFKNSSGTVLYSFNQAQLIAGITVPQGTYTLSFVVQGQGYDMSSGLGWYYCNLYFPDLYSGYFSYSSSTGTYTIAGVTMTGSTGTIYLSANAL